MNLFGLEVPDVVVAGVAGAAAAKLPDLITQPWFRRIVPTSEHRRNHAQERAADADADESVVSALRIEVESLKTLVETWRGEASVLRADFNTTRIELAGTRAELTTARIELAGTRTELAEVKARLVQVSADLEREHRDRLEAEAREAALSDRVDELERGHGATV